MEYINSLEAQGFSNDAPDIDLVNVRDLFDRIEAAQKEAEEMMYKMQQEQLQQQQPQPQQEQQ